MYLSKLTIRDPKTMANPYELHRLIWRLFPQRPEGERDFLFRVEPGRPPEIPALLLSEQVPEDVDPACCLLSEPRRFAPRFPPGQLLRFRLCANPVKRLAKERCRVPLIDDGALGQWLRRKLDPVARLVEFNIAGRRDLRFYKRGRRGKVAAVTFEGSLEAVDPEGLIRLIRAGIGPAKAFGCGLMTIARG